VLALREERERHFEVRDRLLVKESSEVPIRAMRYLGS
jgi:hypothetical protein